MTDIDPTTGLPKLDDPELFFRVTESGVFLVRRLPDTIWEDEWMRYSDYESSFSECEYRDVSYMESKSTWWGGTREEVKTKREFRYVKRSKILTRAKTKETGTRKDYDHYLRQIRDYPTYASITKEDIVPLAEKALEEYHAIQAHKSLLGDYPPKSL